MVVRGDLLPRPQQVAHALFHAAAAIVAFGVVLEGLRVDAVAEGGQQALFQFGGRLVDAVRAFGRGQPPFQMAGEAHQCAGEAAIQRSGGEWRDAADFHGAVERLVVVAKALVVGAVAGLVHVEQRCHQAGALRVAPDAAGGLDVLGVGLRLA